MLDNSNLFYHRKALIITKHNKEKVIAPILKEALGLDISVATKVDTDEFGTFSGEIERPDTQYNTAKLKILKAFELYPKAEIAIASEGAFTPHPDCSFIPLNTEIVLLIDRRNQLEISAKYLSLSVSVKEEIVSTMEQMEKGMSVEKRDVVQDKRDLKLIKILKTGKNPDVKIMNLITELKQYQLKIEVFLTEYKSNPDNWVLEQSYNERLRQKELSLEPIWANDYLDKYVFSHYDMVFLMSGTILDKDLFCTLNGLDVNKAAYHSIESPFPVKNRPIIYMPLGKMSYAKKEETFQRYIPYIKKILNKYAGQKGVIHTNSFELSNWIQKSIKDPRLIFHDSTNKDEMLKLHCTTDRPTVLVSPSVHTGVSFDDDLARFQIIAKVPYPSLASQKNKMRQSVNPDWYAWKTAGSLQQSSGRIVRSDKDYGDTIIIDASFGDVMRHSSQFLPDWVQNAIKRINIKVTS